MSGARIITRLQWATAACIAGGVILGLVTAVFLVLFEVAGTRAAWAFILPHALGLFAGLGMGARQAAVIRRARRASFQLCDNCLYPCDGFSSCPECGQDVRDAARRWKYSVGGE